MRRTAKRIGKTAKREFIFIGPFRTENAWFLASFPPSMSLGLDNSVRRSYFTTIHLFCCRYWNGSDTRTQSCAIHGIHVRRHSPLKWNESVAAIYVAGPNWHEPNDSHCIARTRSGSASEWPYRVGDVCDPTWLTHNSQTFPSWQSIRFLGQVSATTYNRYAQMKTFSCSRVTFSGEGRGGTSSPNAIYGSWVIYDCSFQNTL